MKIGQKSKTFSGTSKRIGKSSLMKKKNLFDYCTLNYDVPTVSTTLLKPTLLKAVRVPFISKVGECHLLNPSTTSPLYEDLSPESRNV